VQNADQTFGAIGAQNAALTAGLRQLPATLRQGTTTFVDLLPTLDALTQLTNASKPNTRTLAAFLQALAPLLKEAKGPVTNLGLAISRPGANNDLTDVALDIPALESQLAHTSPDTVASLQAATPVTTFMRPYTPDLVGFLRTFGETSANYDAAGHYARLSAVLADFGSAGDNTLTPVNPMSGLANLQTGQTKRCPGAATAPPADGSAPYTVGGTLDCSPSEVPAG